MKCVSVIFLLFTLNDLQQQGIINTICIVFDIKIRIILFNMEATSEQYSRSPI